MSLGSDDMRQTALKQLQERRDFVPHLLVYVLVNAGLVGVWIITGHGLFWPGFVIAGWGIGLVMHAWSAFLRRPITDAEVDRYLERLNSPSGDEKPQ